MGRTQMPRRRRRRRRRPPSKCHLLIAEVEICSKHSFYLRALKITVIHLTDVSNSLCAARLYHPAKAIALFCNIKNHKKMRICGEKKKKKKKLGGKKKKKKKKK